MLLTREKRFIVIIFTYLLLTSCQKGQSQEGEDEGDFAIRDSIGIYANPASWKGCPAPDDFSNDSKEAISIKATDEAVYCATFYEDSSLKEGLERKALLRIAPGNYFLLVEGGNDIGLPFCLRMGEDTEPIGADVGQATRSDIEGFYYRLEQPVKTHVGFQLQAVFSNEIVKGEPIDIVLNGVEDPALYLAFFDTYKPLSEIDCNTDPCFWNQQFDSCTHASSHLNRHDVQLDTGDISFEIRIADPTSGTQNAAFVRAGGNFRGQKFEQRNYFKLVYSPSYHHFVRNFAVLFDEPMDGVCGVEVTGLEDLDIYGDDADSEDPMPFNDVVDEAYAVDCELNHLEELTVQHYTLTVDP